MKVGWTTTQLYTMEQGMTETEFKKYVRLLKQFSEILGLTISECYFEREDETIDWEDVEE